MLFKARSKALFGQASAFDRICEEQCGLKAMVKDCDLCICRTRGVSESDCERLGARP
jgi:hypothetical protein